MTKKTRETILEAGVAVFSEVGLDRATVKDVLLEAKVSRRTFYQYFKSKDDVLLALYERVANQLVEIVDTALQQADSPVRRVLDAIDAYLDFEQKGGRLLMLLQAEAIRPESPLSVKRREVLDRLVTLFDDAVAETLNVRVDPLVYWGLLNCNDGLVIHMQRDGAFTDSDRERVRSVIAPIFVNVLAGVAHLPRRPGDDETP